MIVKYNERITFDFFNNYRAYIIIDNVRLKDVEYVDSILIDKLRIDNDLINKLLRLHKINLKSTILGIIHFGYALQFVLGEPKILLDKVIYGCNIPNKLDVPEIDEIWFNSSFCELYNHNCELNFLNPYRLSLNFTNFQGESVIISNMDHVESIKGIKDKPFIFTDSIIFFDNLQQESIVLPRFVGTKYVEIEDSCKIREIHNYNLSASIVLNCNTNVNKIVSEKRQISKINGYILSNLKTFQIDDTKYIIEGLKRRFINSDTHNFVDYLKLIKYTDIEKLIKKV